jgi:hypothetical protein
MIGSVGGCIARIPRAGGTGAGISRGQAIRESDIVLRQVRPDLNATARKIVLAIVVGESDFGLRGSFLTPDGFPSNNWGARKGRVTGPEAGCDGTGCIEHGDADEKGKVCFSCYATPQDGARGFFKTRAWGTSPYKEATIAAANAGDIYGVAKSMKDASYYTGFGCNGKVAMAPNNTSEDIECAIASYVKLIKNGVAEVSNALGQPNDDTFVELPSKGVFSGNTKVVAAAAGLGLAYWLTIGSGYKYTKSVLPLEGVW